MKKITEHEMKTRIATTLLKASGTGAALFLAQAIHAQTPTLVYGNTTTYQNANYDFNQGSAYAEAGNEVVLAGAPAGQTAFYNFEVTQATVQFDLSGTSAMPSGNEAVELNFYQNNGAIVSGSASPGSLIWSSGFTTASQLGLSSFTTGSTLTYTPDIGVPGDFTWTLAFANLGAGESGGLGLFTPPTVGAVYGDAWVNNGSGWALVDSTTSVPLEFGASITAITPAPEPSTIALGVMGGAAFLARLRRKS